MDHFWENTFYRPDHFWALSWWWAILSISDKIFDSDPMQKKSEPQHICARVYARGTFEPKTSPISPS